MNDNKFEINQELITEIVSYVDRPVSWDINGTPMTVSRKIEGMGWRFVAREVDDVDMPVYDIYHNSEYDNIQLVLEWNGWTGIMRLSAESIEYEDEEY